MVPSARAAFPHELRVSLSAMGAVALLAGVCSLGAERGEGFVPHLVLDAGVGHPSVSERWVPQLQHGVVLGVPPVRDAVLLQIGSEAVNLVHGNSDHEMAVRLPSLGADNDREMNPQPARKTKKKRTNVALVEVQGRQVRVGQRQKRHTNPVVLGELVGDGKLLGHRSK